MNGWTLFSGDAVHNAVSGLLLLMSVAVWVLIFWKSWLLPRALTGLSRSIAAFWQSPSLDAAIPRLQAMDPQGAALALVEAAQTLNAGTLAATGGRTQQLTRALRDALHAALHRLQTGQVLLATVGATAPFVGLLGTVWGIYHALLGIAGAGQVSIDKISGPMGEALIMTAAGLGVAIPAVVAFNVFGRLVGRMEGELEGFAHDLRDLLHGEQGDAAAKTP